MRRRSQLKIRPVRDLLKEKLPEEIQTAEGFARWFEPWRERVMVAVKEIHEAVGRRLDEERRRILATEGFSRRVWEVTGTDGRSLLKSPESARSKLGRELQNQQRNGRLLDGRLSLDQVERLLLRFPDLGRFRVVCDFSCDVRAARRALLTRKPPILLGRYPLTAPPKDYVHDAGLRRPTRGHRAFQFAVRVPAERNIQVEIQLMTVLQAAWDLRNHPVYEWSRDGGELPDPLVLRDVALAEALYLVDLQATANWQRFVRARRRQGETS